MEALNNSFQLVLILCFVVIVGAALSDQNSTCGPGMDTPGVTVPEGDIIIEYGNPLEMLCILDLNKTKYNASSLMFFNNTEQIPETYVNVVNQTTLRLYIEKPPVTTSFISCKLPPKDEGGKALQRKKEGHNEDEEANANQSGVCANFVYVGTKPKEVQNFSCISYNWESLNCSWIPAYNPVHTTYQLSFTLRGKSRKVFECPGHTDIIHNYCLWNATTSPPFRMPYSEYFFILIGKNVFGNLTRKYKINHYGVVLPRRPENLSCIQATSSSLTISWSLPLTLKVFPVEIVSKVIYQSRWDPPSYWQEADTSQVVKNGDQRILNITGLEYAHTFYDIKILIRSSQAEDTEEWWSKPNTISVRTKAAVPGMPPKTVVGNFESTPRANDSNHRNVYIYWQNIPQKFENGEGFGYNFTSVEEIVDGKHIPRNIKPTMYNYYALFERLTYNAYIFKIVSYNNEGPSKEFSTVVIPSKAYSQRHPLSFKKVAYDHGLFELSWKPPPENNISDHDNIRNYTIFWCGNKFDKPYGCNDILNWTIVSKTVTKMNISLLSDKIYQFAISANSFHSSSGMIWAHCTYHLDQDRGNFKSIWVDRIAATYMVLGWKLECIRSPINGFLIEYCPVRDINQSQCEAPEKNLRFGRNVDPTRYNITNLQPFTTYRIGLCLVTEAETLAGCDVTVNTTFEAAPSSPPMNLTLLEVTNTSITISWRPPRILNGVLKNYELSWNKNHTVINNTSSVVQYTLKHLASYEVYVIKVVACTVACSSHYASLKVTTKIGFPGILRTPIVTYFDKTDFNITWFPLSHERGGKNDYYEIKIQTLNEQKDNIINETTKRYYSPNGMNSTLGPMQILTAGCQEADSSTVYRVQVRTVNEDNGNIFPGHWSPPAEGFCHTNRLSFAYVVLLSIVGILLLLVLFAIIAYMTRCIWRHCKAMQNIQVKLPPQLELDMYKDKVIDIPVPSPITQLKPPNSDNSDTPPPDQQLLLDKKDKEELVESSSEDCEDVSGDRESSGCGSGHESVSSSITAGTHITDSGTEADERPEDVFPDSPRRGDRPRQRNVSRNGSGGEGYCILAQAPSGYVSLPPMSNYVKHDWTPNPQIKGYDLNGSLPSPNQPSNRPPSTETSWAT